MLIGSPKGCKITARGNAPGKEKAHSINQAVGLGESARLFFQAYSLMIFA